MCAYRQKGLEWSDGTHLSCLLDCEVCGMWGVKRAGMWVESCSRRNGPGCRHRQGKQISLDVSIPQLGAHGSLSRQSLRFTPPSLALQWKHFCTGYLLNDKMISEGDSQSHNLFIPPFIGKQPCPSLYVFSGLLAPTVTV